MKRLLAILKSAPVIIAGAVILLACSVEIFRASWAQKAEYYVYNVRVRFAQRHFQKPAATNLGFVCITDQTIEAVNNGSLGFRYGLYWPRHVYGRVLEELREEGAKKVAFDVLFSEARPDHQPVVLSDGTTVGSDEYFAQAIRKSKSVILSADEGVMPIPLLVTNACGIGNISMECDLDGVLRRDVPFVDYKIWHPAILRSAAELGCDLNRIRMEKGKLILVRDRAEGTSDDPKYIELPMDSGGRIDASVAFPADWFPPGSPKKIKPFTVRRVWSMGIMLAASELGLDLEHPVLDRAGGRLTLNGTNGVSRTIPLDSSGHFLINWSIRPEDDILTKGALEELLRCYGLRMKGKVIPDYWRGKLVLIGSIATGNDLTDLGTTPLGSHTYLVSKHWNVANSVITNQFITPCGRDLKLALIMGVGLLTALVTWKCQPLVGALVIMAFLFFYVVVAFWLFGVQHFWLPVATPLLLSCVLMHVCMVTYLVRVEQVEQRRVKTAFSKVLAPKIVNTLLTQKVALGGARRELTVFFADIRGFTELTDTFQTRAEEYVREHNLSTKEAEAYFDSQAKIVLQTVSQCLGIIAETIKRHDGTLDKYIGDCVMAFWGAPTADPRHALHCVRTAIDAQRAVQAFNDRRVLENKRIESENALRIADGLPPWPQLPLISLGTGINTGISIAGFMGSEKDILNYTVFGREINLAARLEGISGHGRILIGESTYLALKRDDPELAVTCVELEPFKVKGFRDEVKAYEVPWRDEENAL